MMIGIRAAMASVILLMLLNLSIASATTTVTFQPGAYIIDMGNAPGSITNGNGLKPYGLVYDLAINKQIPVAWAINPAKAKDGIDFTVPSGTGAGSYRGGSFIISKEFASLAAPTIATWITKGVIVKGPTTATFSAPIYGNITSFPNAVCDLQNGGIIISAFYTPSEVPSSSYRLGSPQDLKDCDDIYAMPHADPHKWTTAQKTTFSNFINTGGCLWAACHAVSSMEADAPTYFGQYYLSQNGLIPWGSHAGPVLPYAYNATSATHPIMQFIGKVDNALQSGSEKVYIPDYSPSTNNWRTSTTVAVWSPNQPNVYPSRPGVKAAIVAYGHAFGDPNKGYITYEASHSISTGNVSENVDAARIYGNFLLYCGVLSRPEITASVPVTVLSGETIPLSASVGNGTPPYTYAWSSTCAGSFTNPTAPNTIYAAPIVTTPTTCIIRLTITDSCSRRNFAAKAITILPKIMTLSKTDFKTVTQPGDILNYTINYSNTGTVPTTNVTIVDVLPKEVTYISAYPTPVSVAPGAGGTTIITWNIGTVSGPSGIKKVLLNASVKDTVSVGDSVIDNVNLSYWAYNMGPIVITAQDKDEVVPVTKMVDKTLATAGQTLNYTICPAYDSTKLLTSALVEDVLPAYTITPTNINASGFYTVSNNTIRWNLGSNVKGTTGKVNPTANTKGFFRNVAINDSYVIEDQVANNYGSCTVLGIRGAGSKDANALLYFSLPTLPVNAVFDKALLDVYVTKKDDNAGNAIVHRLTRSWCLNANSVCKCCQGLIVEGLECNNKPDPGYGVTWTNYNYGTVASINCPWTTAGGDFSATVFGTFDATSKVRTTGDITNLVRGWYNGTYANQGILMRPVQTNQNPEIGSRENTQSPDEKPYLNVSYTVSGVPAYQRLLATNDTYLDSGQTIRNYGITEDLKLQNGGGNNNKYAIMYFTLPTLPVGAVLTSAKLDVFVTTQKPTLVNIYRMTRNWCLSSNSACGTCCDGNIVEGTVNDQVPSTTTGATWSAYKYGDILACPWTVTGGDYDATSFGTFSLTTQNVRVTSDISNLVRGWYNSTYAVQGILIAGSADKDTEIGSRDNIDSPDKKPYLNVSYIIYGQPGTNVSIWAHPLLTCESGKIKINMTVNATESILVTPPATLTITGTNGATATYFSGPSPASATIPANTNYNFTYVYNILPGANPGSVTFTGKPTSASATFANGVSNSVLVTPKLTYRVTIDPSTPNSVNSITNDAKFQDSNAIPLGVTSPPVVTNLFWPASIQTTKIANVSSGSPSTMINFTMSVKNTNLATLDPVTVVDTLPAGIEYITSGNGSANMNVITWSNIGPLAPQQNKTLWFVGHLDGNAYGLLTNVVNASGTTYDGRKVWSNASKTVQSLTVGLDVTKSGNVSVGSPSNFTEFSLHVNNTGQTTLNPVFVQDFLPDGLEYKSSNATSIDLTNNTLTWSNIGPMTGGQKKTLTVIAHINGSYFGELFNSVAVTGKPPSGGNLTATNYTIVTAKEPKIYVTKNVTPTQGSPSTDVNFTINVTNVGEVNFTSLKVEDTLPFGLNYVSSYPAGGVAVGNVITWNSIGTLNIGQYRLVYVKAHINGTKLGWLKNLVSVTGTTNTGWKVTDQNNTSVLAMRPALSIVKTANLSTGAPSTNINFTIQVANTGNVTLNPVKVVDTLPFGLNYVSSGNGSAAGNVITWTNIGPMAPGQTKQLWMVSHINGSAYGALNNTVQVTGTPPTGNNVTNQSYKVVTAQSASITITKTSDVSIGAPSTNVNFTLTVKNNGQVPLNPVKVVDTLPTGLNYVSSDNGSAVGNVVTWADIGSITPGQIKQLWMVAHINGSAFGDLNNTVQVTGTPPTGTNVTNQSYKIVTAETASILVSKTAEPTLGTVGDVIKFTIKISNTGQSTLSLVSGNDTLPAGLTYDFSNPSNRTPVQVTGQLVVWPNLGSLAAGQSTYVQFNATIDGTVPGVLVNTIKATGKPTNGSNVTSQATASVEAFLNANFTVTKTALNESVGPDENAVFIINVTNTGDVGLPTVKVVDVLPIGLVYVSDNSTPQSVPSGNLRIWNNVGPLAAGASKFIQLVAKVQL